MHFAFQNTSMQEGQTMASLWGKAVCPGHPFGSCRRGVGDTLGYNGLFPETLSQQVYEVCFLISWRSATSISAAVQRTLHPLPPQWATSEGIAHQWLGGFWLRDFWSVLLSVVSWGLRLITRHALTHSTQGFADRKQYEINLRFSITETLTAGLGFTGISQALWKSLLSKNLIFFRSLARELKQLRDCRSLDQSSSGCEAIEDNIVCLSSCAPSAHKPTFQRSYLAVHQFAAACLSISWSFLLLSSTDWQLFPPRCKSFDEREYTGTFSS